MREFKEYLEEKEAGRFLVNPFWLEHLLNLFHQEYFAELWEEITETKMNQLNNLDTISYGTIGRNWNGKK